MKRIAILLWGVISFVAVGLSESEDGFKGKLGLGFDSASGNSEVMALTADLELGHTSGKNATSFEFSYGYATTDSELSRQNSRVSLNYDRALSERLYSYVRAENVYDKIALVDYRLTAGPGAGVFLIKNESLSLKTDLGVSFIDQKLRDDSLENNFDSIMALRLTEKLEYKISDSANLWQSVEYLPNTDEFDSYLLNCELGVETSITGSTSLRVVAASRRNSDPPAGVDKDDVTVQAAMMFSLGGK